MSAENDSVTVHIEYMVKQLSNSCRSKPTIYKVDEHLRQVNEEDYEPEIIAIGPIHHGKDHVKDMEWHKLKYLQQTLQRTELSIEKCVMEVRELEEKARYCYGKSLQLNQDEFVEMLVLDGCFVIELLRKYLFDDLREKNDLIFQFDQTLSKLRHDLMLFENQLPFFILNQLFDMTKMENPEDNISYLAHFFMDDLLPWLDVSRLNTKSDAPNSDHLLGLVYQDCFSFSNMNFIKKETCSENNLVHINSTSKLKESGIQLRGSRGIALSDVTFTDGILKLPQLTVSDKTESIIRNLIAYEQCLSNDHTKYVTDFAYLMHCLVKSTNDIEILRHCGIITNLLGGDKMVYQMFSRLGKNVLTSSDFSYSSLFDSVNRHCGIRRKKWMAKLRRNYFNSPWSFVSFLAAFILLLLTLIQTVFSVISYRKH